MASARCRRRPGWCPSQKYDVIHYVRETFLKRDNPTQFAVVDRAYLDRLPKGTTRGPEPSTIEPWSAMDYGPTLTATYEVGDDGSNFAYKGVAVRLDAGPGGVSRGRHWTVFDHDTMRLAAAWSGDGFIDWNGINFNGRHEIHPRVVGLVEFANPVGPGWANPQTGTFDDPRLKGTRRPALRPAAPIVGPLPGPVPPRRPGHPRVHRRQYGRAGNAGGRDGTRPRSSAVPSTSVPAIKEMVLQVARGPKARLRTLASGDGAPGAVAFLGPERGSASELASRGAGGPV